MKIGKAVVATALAAALGIASTQLFADPPSGSDTAPGGWGGWGYGMGPGMMQGYGWGGGYGMGPGMMQGYGPGYGMGPGMMQGYGPGYGMGPGMMYGYGPGYGMGPGMGYGGRGGWQGGYGMGPGMMYGYGYGGGLDLTDDQRSKIGKIQQDLRSKQWDLMGKMHDAYARRADASDDAAAEKADDQIAQLQQQMLGNATAARKAMAGVLTKEQRAKLRRGGY